MAILKSVVDVNNGNTGWTKSDVLDALETVFANLGWNNGTAATGVPCVIKAPGWSNGNSSADLNKYRDTTSQWTNQGNNAIANFRHCGGDVAPNGGSKNRYFIVSNNGTSAYRMVEEFRINGNTGVELNGADQIFEVRHGISTGDVLHYAAGIASPDAAKVINGLSADTIYYAIKVDDDNFKVAANATDAGNGTAINITAATTTGYYFRRQDTSALDNITITCKLSDTLNFITSGASGAGGTFNLVYNSDSYDAAKLLTKYDNNWQAAPTGNASDGSVDTVWNTQAYRQTENEVLDPLRAPDDGAGTATGDQGIIKYIYANSTNASMKGEIVVEPWVFQNGSNFNPYWKYTVPASGSRSELKLRVYRGNRWYDQAYIVAITINSIGSGWTDDAVFTIPGEEIGGVATTNDVTFGVNADETSNNAYDGTPSIGVTDLKSGSNFYQKHPSGFYAIANVEHDAAKAFGTTYYGFGMNPDNDYKLTITSGCQWDYLNRPGIHYNIGNEDNVGFGTYGGKEGVDRQNIYSYVRMEEGQDIYWREINYATSATPTAYPLAIRVYRAQAPQDSDFAIIQFTQTINGVIQPYGTFTIAKGSQHGAGVYDLDYVFQDAVMEVGTGTRSIQFKYGNTQYNYYAGVSEPADSNTKTRAASYGYMRDGEQDNDYGTQTTSFTCNIDTDNGNAQTSSSIKTYYRNSTYDSYTYTDGTYGTTTNAMSSSADYYKPIKGIPISSAVLPIPYYLPDDFVMLQVATTPGLVAFRTGDTITISGSEIYEIITASYESQQNGLDNVQNNSTIGMLFMARTT
jgi:hypothetical protein